MAKRKKLPQSLVAPATLSPEAKAVCRLYERIAERLGVLSQMMRHLSHSHASGAFKAFLGSPAGYNEAIDDSRVLEDWVAHSVQMIHHTIVMLHATTEDVIRTLASMRLPSSSADALKEIPINRPDGLGDVKLRELGQLVPHRNQSVDSLIRMSIDSWLDRQTFNNAQQVVAMLEKINIPIELVRIHFPTIERIASLRHQIAHTGEIREDDLSNLLDGPSMDSSIRDIYLFAKTLLIHAVPPVHTNFLKVQILVSEEINRRRGMNVS